MAIKPVQQADIDATARLLERMLPESLEVIVFETTQPPFPEAFSDPEHSLTKFIVGVLNRNIIGFTTGVTVRELQLTPDQVDQLQVEDPRVVSLKQRVKEEIAKIPPIVQLREARIKLIKEMTPN